MLQLWFSKISDTIEIERSAKALLSDTEIKRLSSTKSHYKRREFLLSRYLMRHALSQYLPRQIDEWSFTERENMLPKISDLPSNTYISLSHSKSLICFAISDSPVGVDVELADTNRDFLALAKMFMNDEELMYFKQNTEIQTDIFYRTWCNKEAYYKSLTPELQTETSLKNIPINNLFKTNKSLSLIEGKVGQYYVSATMKTKHRNVSYNYFSYNNTHHFEPTTKLEYSSWLTTPQ